MGKLTIYNLAGCSACDRILKEYPDYKIFWRSGYAYKGAAEVEDDKQLKKEYVYQEGRSRETTFEERMLRRYKWAAAIDITVDHEKKEIHLNGFSENDLY